MSIRNLVNIPGFSITVDSDRDKFIKGAAEAAGSRAYAGTAALAGRVYDDSAKVVEAGDQAAALSQRIVSVSYETSSAAISDAIASTTKTGQRIYKATKGKAKVETQKRLARPTAKVIAVRKAASDFVTNANEAIDNYCDDAPPLMLAAAPTQQRRARKA